MPSCFPVALPCTVNLAMSRLLRRARRRCLCCRSAIIKLFYEHAHLHMTTRHNKQYSLIAIIIVVRIQPRPPSCARIKHHQQFSPLPVFKTSLLDNYDIGWYSTCIVSADITDMESFVRTETLAGCIGKLRKQIESQNMRSSSKHAH